MASLKCITWSADVPVGMNLSKIADGDVGAPSNSVAPANQSQPCLP